MRLVVLIVPIALSASPHLACARGHSMASVVSGPGAASVVSASWGAPDAKVFAARISAIRELHLDELPMGKFVAAIGKLFIGTPYVSHTLDMDSVNEALTIDLHELDCATFYETSLAFARMFRISGDLTMKALAREITTLRYRDGRIDGFRSRLHYTTDYFFDNERRGALNDVTALIGGKYARRDTRTIDFMTRHRALYKQIATNETEFEGILRAESAMKARKGFSYIPKAEISRVESRIENGDIIGITTNIEGLDCSHTGIAIRMDDGRIHFLHASSLRGEVMISEVPLAEYLEASTHQTGIIVARPQEPR